MNPREKKLLVALLATVGVGLLGGGTWMWFVVPLKAYNTRIMFMKEEREKVQATIDEFNRDRKKIAMARVKSLPATPNEASAEYDNYLHTIFPAAGLRVEEVNPQNPVEMKPVSNIAGIKKVGHQIMGFQVKLKGTWPQFIKGLEAMQKTPYEHRIKSVTIDRAEASAREPNPKIVINMIIETLLVAGTQSRPGHPPGVDVQSMVIDGAVARMGVPTGFGQIAATLMLKQSAPTFADRQYADISKRNIFAGAMPKVEKKEKEKYVPPPPQPPPYFLRAIRLDFIEVGKQEANYLNLYYRKDEKKISAKENSGYNTFVIEAEDRDYRFFFAKVIRVDQRAVFFQVKDKVYQWHIGDTLETAYATSLTLDYMDALDLEPDYAWAKKEMEKDGAKEKTSKKTTTKKRAN